MGKPGVKSSLKEVGVDGRIILKSILKKNSRRLWTGFIWFWIWTSGRSREYSNIALRSLMRGISRLAEEQLASL